MPELPEVETIINDLRELTLGRRIDQAEIRDPRVLRKIDPVDFAREVAGQRIVDVQRRAKYLLVKLSSGCYLVVQLLITGQLLLVESQAPLRRATRLIFDLADGQQLRLVDDSHLARVHLLQPAELNSRLHLDTLGPEPLSDDFTLEDFYRRLSGRGATIKSLLLDQHVVAGIGNIYADEVLFKARIHPAERARNLTFDQVRRLYDAIKQTLRAAIAARGTTTRHYLDVMGRKGEYQHQLLVFGRQGQPCPGCRGQVERIVVAGRRTHICASCQALSRHPQAA